MKGKSTGGAIAKATGGAVAGPAGAAGGFKRGGGVAKKKRDHEKMKYGGEVDGEAGPMRLDKRARGGRMTPKSPLSGADTSPLGFEKDTTPKLDTGGSGKKMQGPD